MADTEQKSITTCERVEALRRDPRVIVHRRGADQRKPFVRLIQTRSGVSVLDLISHEEDHSGDARE